MTSERKIENGICKTKLVDYNSFFNEETKNRKLQYLRHASDLAQKLIDESPDEVFSLSTGIPNPKTFPFAKLDVTLKDGTCVSIEGQYMEEAMRYPHAAGYGPLRQLLKKVQEKENNIRFDEKRDLILSYGAQDALFKILSMFLSRGDPIIVQHPVYPGTIAALSAYKVEYITAETNNEGLCTSTLEKKLQERMKNNLKMPKLMYISPTGSNPTSIIIPEKNKREIYKLACKYNFLIVVDDPYFYLTYYEEQPPISFLSMDTEYRVIRIESFSKIICPGLRLGVITGAKEILDKIVLHVESSAAPSNFSMIILFKLLQQWGYENFRTYVTNHVVLFYKELMENMLQHLEKYCKDIGEWQTPKAGFFIWFRIKGIEHVNENFISYCLKHLLLTVPGLAFSVTDEPSPYIRLSFALVQPEKLEKAIKLLADVIKKYYKI